ncbi:CYTH domain-containing protein [Mucilaginibacter pallidiroseus]|uniref:CYTH domain-containing protein n=1 Tax=Mucilaginibacter pallidiroseus TaxID=2599295 RepID=A0A563UCA1_9SPHI|nr:CYTH domain-containing protein [Mucilaginibacter pallidiroseus]TWR29008.1 CYTH domain-containing protein [Mucilaginibacter pallidiroseus]
MGIEIERKFLVDHIKWAAFNKPEGNVYRQGYILSDVSRTVRIRVTNKSAFITLKGGTTGISRSEFEYEIPIAEGIEILKGFAVSSIEKVRYNIPYKGHTWEVDVFEGDNAGLIVAEIELQSEEAIFEKPDWVTKEVSEDGRYTNASLSVNPFKNWN